MTQKQRSTLDGHRKHNGILSGKKNRKFRVLFSTDILPRRSEWGAHRQQKRKSVHSSASLLLNYARCVLAALHRACQCKQGDGNQRRSPLPLIALNCTIFHLRRLHHGRVRWTTVISEAHAMATLYRMGCFKMWTGLKFTASRFPHSGLRLADWRG